MLPIPTPTSREALYQELWTRPIPELLNRYGVCEITSNRPLQSERSQVLRRPSTDRPPIKRVVSLRLV